MRVLKLKKPIKIAKKIGNFHIKTLRRSSIEKDKHWTELHCWYECDCQNCPLSWVEQYYEDCDCGCWMAEYGEEYPKSLLVCMLPKWAKNILLRRVEKRQEKEDLQYLEYLDKNKAESEET